MTRNEKKAVIESMAEKFMNIDDLEGKSMTIMVMSAYAEGKAAGKAEECWSWIHTAEEWAEWEFREIFQASQDL